MNCVGGLTVSSKHLIQWMDEWMDEGIWHRTACFCTHWVSIEYQGLCTNEGGPTRRTGVLTYASTRKFPRAAVAGADGLSGDDEKRPGWGSSPQSTQEGAGLPCSLRLRPAGSRFDSSTGNGHLSSGNRKWERLKGLTAQAQHLGVTWLRTCGDKYGCKGLLGKPGMQRNGGITHIDTCSRHAGSIPASSTNSTPIPSVGHLRVRATTVKRVLAQGSHRPKRSTTRRIFGC